MKASVDAEQKERETRRHAVTEAWYGSSDIPAFIAALEQIGYILARDERQSCVVVDSAGAVHSLTRQIEGGKPKEIRARLEGISLPGVPAAQERAKQPPGDRASTDQGHAEKNLLLVLAPYALLIVCVLLAYANIYHNAFLYDDIPAIVQNTFLRHWSDLPNLLTGPSFAGSSIPGGFHRPLLMLLWFFTYQVFGPSAPAFHALNILLHAANACLLFQLGCGIGLRRWVSFAAALLWAVHPLNTEAVDYISSLDDPLYVLFLLLGLLVLLPDFAPRKFWLAGLMFVFALASKESAVVFPALATITLWLVSKKRLHAATYYRTWPLWLVAGLFIAGYLANMDVTGEHHQVSEDLFFNENYVHNLANRILTFLATLPVYFSLMVWPAGLHMERRSFPVFTSLWSWQVLTGAAMVCGIFVQILWGRARRGLTLSWGFLWFAVAYSTYTGILVTVDYLIAERWMYLPTIGLALGIAGTLQLWLDRKSVQARVVAASLVAITVLVLGVKTHIQNKIWRNPETFYGNIIQCGEINGHAYNNLGIFYLEQGEFEKAIEQFRLAIAHPVESTSLPSLHISLAAAYLGVRPDKTDLSLQGEMQALRRALPFSAHIPEAIEELNKALEIAPRFYFADMALAVIFNYQGDNEKAIEQYRLAMPHYREQADLLTLHMHLAAAYLGVRINADDSLTLPEVNQALHSSSHIPEAIEELNKALEIDPNFIGANATLAVIFNYQGDNEKALFYKHRAEAPAKENEAQH